MNEHFPKQDIIDSGNITIYNYHSSIDNYYRLTSSYQLTCEFCSGTAPSDYVNFASLSPSVATFSTTPAMEFFSLYNKRPLHHHNFYEFMMVLDGDAVHRIENTEYSYSEGTVCLINKNIRHAEKLIGSARLLFLALSPAFFEEIIHSVQYESFSGEKDLLSGEIFTFIQEDLKNHSAKNYLDFYPTLKNAQSAKQLHDLTDELLKVMMNPFWGAGYAAKGLILKLLQFLSSPDNYYIAPVALDSQKDFLLFSHISHFLEDKNGIASRSELEEKFHYSGSYINSIVKKYAGMCLFDYRMKFCMKEAARLLTETRRSISDIITELQFANSTHFYNQFKKAYDITPLQYRKLHEHNSL